MLKRLIRINVDVLFCLVFKEHFYVVVFETTFISYQAVRFLSTTFFVLFLSLKSDSINISFYLFVCQHVLKFFMRKRLINQTDFPYIQFFNYHVELFN